MANEIQFANAVIKIDGTTVARVTSARRSTSMNEVDVTGAENVSGTLADKQFIPTSIEETLELEGVSIAGAAAKREAGQTDLIAAAEAGSSIVLQVLDPNGYGDDFTGHFTAFQEGASVDDVFKWSATMRVNSKAAVTP